MGQAESGRKQSSAEYSILAIAASLFLSSVIFIAAPQLESRAATNSGVSLGRQETRPRRVRPPAPDEGTDGKHKQSENPFVNPVSMTGARELLTAASDPSTHSFTVQLVTS